MAIFWQHSARLRTSFVKCTRSPCTDPRGGAASWADLDGAFLPYNNSNKSKPFYFVLTVYDWVTGVNPLDPKCNTRTYAAIPSSELNVKIKQKLQSSVQNYEGGSIWRRLGRSRCGFTASMTISTSLALLKLTVTLEYVSCMFLRRSDF